MNIHITKNTVSQFSTIALFLVICICTLCFLDAPEYVHCKHIGICEFLEISGELEVFNKGKSPDLIDDLLFEIKTIIYQTFASFPLSLIKTIIFLSISSASIITSKYFQPFQIFFISIIRC